MTLQTTEASAAILTLGETAQLLGIGRRRLTRMIAAGIITCLPMVGRKRCILRSTITHFINGKSSAMPNSQ